MKIIETSTIDFDALTSNEREWVYNGFDAAVTFEVRNALLPQFDPVAQATYDFSRALQAPVMEMSLRGLRVDQNRRIKLLSQIKHDIDFLQTRLLELVRDGVGMSVAIPTWWRSPAQLGQLFYSIMGLNPVRKRNAQGQMAPTTNRDAIEKLALNYIAEPICNHLLILRDLDKKRSFLETGIDRDGRFRYGFNIAGTNTGRLSSSVSDFGTGSNAQNVGRSLRSIFCADPGYKFGNLDLEQADSRNLGALCWNLFQEELGDAAGKYLDACESGDLHTFVCRMANPQLPWPSERTGWRAIADAIAYRDFTYRDMAKRLGHGTNFLGTPQTMSRHTKIPSGQVKDFQHSYFGGFPEIPLYHNYVRYSIKNFSQLTTLFGRRRFFFGRPSEEATIREAVSFSPQSMTAEEINIGMLRLFRDRDPKWDLQLLVQVHDSILFQYKEQYEDEIIPWALEALRAPINLVKGRTFCVPTEAKIGWNWGDKADDNPDGLIKFKGHDQRTRSTTPRLSLRNF